MHSYNAFLNSNGPALLVYVLEKNHLSARYLSQILTQEPGIVSRTLADISGCSDSPLENKSCVLVMDQFTLPARSAAYLEKLKKLFPNSVCVLTGTQVAQQDIDALVSEGFLGFVSYGDVEEKLVSAVKSVSRGACWLPGNPALSVMQPKQQADAKPAVEGMTRRESEILQFMVTSRFSNKEIASRLGITETTVKFHVSNIFAKMKVNRRRELLSKFNAPPLSGPSLGDASMTAGVHLKSAS